ncbi:putative retrotransposon gag domain, aspartic peptidase domain superfamily [Helianthus annuus]|uniref:Retrotransposon gag domain, aspartic peptidase domain superfamily n=1 Tax=Helianthus annuus TaxID=4232 RepID=A0A9K3GZ65_HELAN|nr:putative retrotransposon gag domain, aspartic peptidase domain superfamily [Helianthus annuus]KAJ0822460.1 putative retrotransposon gag domain, aspartic peptidase domain superfamily [Helianthus annuus]
MAGKRNFAEFQQDTEERFAKYDALFEKMLGELQTLNVRKEQKDDGVLTINSNHKPYLKLQFPRYGGDDPTGWIYQAEQYFDFQKVAPEDQVQLATFHLDGIALQWHRWYTKSKGPITWLEFTTALLSRFGPTDYDDPAESLHRLKQLTTVAVYVEAFERLSHRVDGLPEPFLVSCFIGGLKEEIRLEVKLKNPRRLVEAIGNARTVEEKLVVQGMIVTTPSLEGIYGTSNVNNSSSMQSGNGLLGAGPSPPLALPAPNPVRRLSAAEARSRREKGLCYYCDDRYTPGHKCSKPQLFMISEVHEVDNKVHVVENADLAQHDPQAEISFIAVSGTILPQTLRLSGRIKNKDVVVLVDGGSTHNFISQTLVDQLGLTIEKDVNFEVLVANEDTLVCAGRVRNLTIMFSGYTLTTDLFVLPIVAHPVVLGIQWLKTLGPVEFDFQDLTIGFRIANSSHKLHGLQRSGLNERQHDRTNGMRVRKPTPVFSLADKASSRGVDCYGSKPITPMQESKAKPMQPIVESKPMHV